MDKIHIFIPTANPNWQYLSRAIDSVLRQTVQNWTLTIIDGSTDTTVSHELQRLAGAQIGYLKNNGDASIAGTWNIAFSECEGRFIQLLHDDDFLDTSYVEKMLHLIAGNPEHALYYCSARTVDSNSTPNFSFPDQVKKLISPRGEPVLLKGDSGLANLLAGCFVFCPTVVYDTHYVPRVPFEKKWSMVLDLAFYYKTIASGFSILGTGEVLYNYRRHNKNQTAKLNRSLGRFKEEIILYDEIYNTLPNSHWQKTRSTAKNKFIIKLHLIYQLFQAFLNLDREQIRKIIDTYPS